MSLNPTRARRFAFRNELPPAELHSTPRGTCTPFSELYRSKIQRATPQMQKEELSRDPWLGVRSVLNRQTRLLLIQLSDFQARPDCRNQRNRGRTQPRRMNRRLGPGAAY